MVSRFNRPADFYRIAVCYPADYTYGLGDIAQQAAEGDVGQQQRFETFADSQVEQNQAYQEHDYVTAGKTLETGVVPYGLERNN